MELLRLIISVGLVVCFGCFEEEGGGLLLGLRELEGFALFLVEIGPCRLLSERDLATEYL